MKKLKPAKPLTADELGKKVLIDTLVAPVSLIPIIGGASVLILGWAFDANIPFLFGAVTSILAGVGIAASRLILGLDSQVERVLEKQKEAERVAQEDALDELQDRLRRDPDARVRSALKELRELLVGFRNDCLDGVASRHSEVASNVEELFRACVTQLQRACVMYERSKSMPDELKKEVLANREEVVKEILAAVETLAKTAQSFHGLTADEGASELNRLRQDLDVSLDVARTTEERMANLGGNRTPNVDEFLKE